MILVFWMLSFKPNFFHSPLSLSSRSSLLQLLQHSSSHSTIRVVSSAYLRLLIFHLAVLIPACVSSSLEFCMMYSAYKLNKQSDNIQPWHTPFPIWNQCCSMSSSNCCFLTCIQVSQEAGQVVWYSCLFQNFAVYCDPHSQRLWQSIKQKQMFFWNSLVFLMIQMLAIWSLFPLPFLKPAWTSGSSRFTYCWSLAWRILSITLLACERSATVQ